MKSRARSRLHELCEEHIQIALERGSYRRVCLDRSEDMCGIDAPCLARALDPCTKRRHLDPEQQRRAEHAFVTDEGNFELGARGAGSHQRNEAVDRKVDVAHAIARLMERRRKLQVDLGAVTDE